MLAELAPRNEPMRRKERERPTGPGQIALSHGKPHRRVSELIETMAIHRLVMPFHLFSHAKENPLHVLRAIERLGAPKGVEEKLDAPSRMDRGRRLFRLLRESLPASGAHGGVLRASQLARRTAHEKSGRPPGLSLGLVGASDGEVLGAEPNTISVGQIRRPMNCPAVQPNAVARTKIFHRSAGLRCEEARVATGNERIVQRNPSTGTPSDNALTERQVELVN